MLVAYRPVVFFLHVPRTLNIRNIKAFLSDEYMTLAVFCQTFMSVWSYALQLRTLLGLNNFLV